MTKSLDERLAEYRKNNKITSKGSLAVVLFVTRKARLNGLPMDSSALKAESAGQISGLSKSAIQTILADYGITKVLAAEGGRTSRGSMKNMEDYVAFLNQLYKEGIKDIYAIEAWWIDCVRDYFSSKPFVFKLDPGVSLNYVVKDLLEQAEHRQKENPGTMYAGAVLQHLVGAKLQMVVPGLKTVEQRGFSVADEPTGYSGDFIVGNTSIHVTTAPSEALMQKCLDNINAGLRPLIVTIYDKVSAAKQLAEIKGVLHRVEIVDAEQFIATNVYEWSAFDSSKQRDSIKNMIDIYNQLIDTYETDPSLKVDLS